MVEGWSSAFLPIGCSRRSISRQQTRKGSSAGASAGTSQFPAPSVPLKFSSTNPAVEFSDPHLRESKLTWTYFQLPTSPSGDLPLAALGRVQLVGWATPIHGLLQTRQHNSSSSPSAGLQNRRLLKHCLLVVPPHRRHSRYLVAGPLRRLLPRSLCYF